MENREHNRAITYSTVQRNFLKERTNNYYAARAERSLNLGLSVVLEAVFERQVRVLRKRSNNSALRKTASRVG